MAQENLPLLGRSYAEFQALVATENYPRFTAKQLCEWLYKKCVTEFDAMTNLSKVLRADLNEKYTLGRSRPLEVHTSRDGTRKYLFAANGERTVETAMIPDADRRTLCVSSQVGCRMHCQFCATGRQPWGGNLSATQILNQILSVEESAELTNLVFMGMGEPLDNIDELLRVLQVLTADWGMAMSPRRITVSTVGVRKGLERFLKESEAHLAISLHTPFEDERRELLPASGGFSLKDLFTLLRTVNWRGQRKLSFEYVVLAGVNDSARHTEELIRILRPVPCLVNLISYHPHDGAEFARPKDIVLARMRDRLNNGGVHTTIRASRGMDIDAACGLLSTTYQNSANKEDEVLTN